MFGRNCIDNTGQLLVFSEKLTFDTFCIVYRIYKRPNIDLALEAEHIYDVALTKIVGERVLDSCCVTALSSSYGRALDFILYAMRYEVTPISLYDCYEQYLSV